jgi:hypothetical protein
MKHTASTAVESQALPVDPVARFHLRNGASLHRLNWLANTSSAGLSASCGMMVNYLYELEEVPVVELEGVPVQDEAVSLAAMMA